jgi:hypothetical protein
MTSEPLKSAVLALADVAKRLEATVSAGGEIDRTEVAEAVACAEDVQRHYEAEHPTPASRPQRPPTVEGILTTFNRILAQACLDKPGAYDSWAVGEQTGIRRDEVDDVVKECERLGWLKIVGGYGHNHGRFVESTTDGKHAAGAYATQGGRGGQRQRSRSRPPAAPSELTRAERYPRRAPDPRCQ